APQVEVTPEAPMSGGPMPMNTPDTIQGSTTRPALGLTGRGRAVVILRRLEQRWSELTPSQQAEAERLLSKLAMTLRAEATGPAPVRVPLVARISA
ncbi:MAG TPA: hypothetical protein VLA19_30295, partial [Herpetosiphonaceae bacterium]|nr:hypothetical protein [Herpetosiphonaceae bacterium]